jgi:hypothetical protein
MTSDEQLSRMEPAKDELYQHLKTEITKRIRHVCEMMPAAEFEELAESMALLELKYRRPDTR